MKRYVNNSCREATEAGSVRRSSQSLPGEGGLRPSVWLRGFTQSGSSSPPIPRLFCHLNEYSPPVHGGHETPTFKLIGMSITIANMEQTENK